MATKPAQTDFYVITGKTPVLLSAPHTFPHLRPNLDGVYKGMEPWLDVVVDSISKDSGVSSIRAVAQLDYDPNYHPLKDNEYKAQVASIVKQGKISHFIDLHGLNDQHEYDFGIFHAVRYSRSKKMAYDFAQAMNKGPLRGTLVQILNLFDNDQETLTEFVSKKLKIPALQVEIARYIREDSELRGGVIDNVSDFIRSL